MIISRNFNLIIIIISACIMPVFDEDIAHTHLERGWPVGIKNKWIILFW